MNEEIAKEHQNLRLAPAATTPIPNPSRESLHLLMKLGVNDTDAKGESPAPASNPSLILSQKILIEGSFSREQKEDECLKHCWRQVQEVD